MKSYINLIFLFLFICISCGSRNISGEQPVASESDTLKRFTLPSIPTVLNTPELRSDFLVRHYWDNVNFADTNYIHHPEITEQAWVDYVDILKLVPDSTARTSIKSLFKSAEAEKKVFLYFTELANKYLRDPNSPMRNEEYYIPVLDVMLETTLLDDVEKIRPQARRKLAEQNRQGKPAIDFSYTSASGKSGTLYSLKAEYTLLFFNNPGCQACGESIEEIKWASAINKEMAAGKLKILAVYPDEEVDEWKKHLADFPREWINGYDKGTRIKEKNLYDLKAIPTLYLLDKNKTVLLKDATVMQIEEYLAQ
ncbi:DUF5106 domain-containing protein [Bacteroides sp. UBA939]|uniref:DUF5106 domain-containing protein n=1 Tax=Bacteroides sp. UBA939 TaxID=1946092 RepID=UPI0025C1941C|nr:DUF5106 domain-containing protein [Bacteroides sp. UBA939]